jgi:hypothetical protein
MPIQGDQTRKKTIYQGPPKDSVRATHRWWLDKPEDAFKGVWAVCEDILTNLAVRRRMNYFFAAIYNDTGAAFMASRHQNLYYNRTALDGNAMLNSNISLNALQNCIDTATALIAKNKPKPQFATDGSTDYAEKVRGQRLTKYVGGVFDEAKVYDKAQTIFRDACVYGTGALKLIPDEGKIRCENLFIEEILIDDLEGMHEAPLQIHQRKYRQRDELLAEFPEYEEEIRVAEQVSGGTATFSTADIIPVIESWHLRSGKKAKDGAHTICINNCTLFHEKYTKDYYPIIFFRWARQTLGFWGRGICHETWKLQRELDIALQTIQRAQRLVSGPIILVENASQIVEDVLTSNKLAKIIPYTNVKPDILTPPIVQPEIYQHVEYLEQRIYNIAGVPQTNAQGTKDPTLKSAVAQREAMDEKQGRFQLVAQRWEEMFLDIARIVVDMSADLSKDNAELFVLADGSDGAERIDFKKAHIDLERCRLQCFPISGLPSTPAGRLDQLMDYAQAGYLSKEQVMDIVEWPDLKGTTDLVLAPYRTIQKLLSGIKEEGKYKAPDVYMNLQLAYQMACQEVGVAENENVKPEWVDLIRRFADEVKDLMDAGTQQQAAAQQQQGMAGQMQMGTAAQVGQTQVGQPMPPTAAPPPQAA